MCLVSFVVRRYINRDSYMGRRPGISPPKKHSPQNPVAALRGGAGGAGRPGRSMYRGRRTDLNKKIINAFIKENVRFMNVF